MEVLTMKEKRKITILLAQRYRKVRKKAGFLMNLLNSLPTTGIMLAGNLQIMKNLFFYRQRGVKSFLNQI